MKNKILCFCILFYYAGTVSAQIDSIITVLEKALQVQVDSFGEGHLNVAMYSDSLGKTHIEAGNYQQAHQLFKSALAIKKEKFEGNHPGIATSFHNIGNVYYYTAEYQKAISEYTKALTIRLEVFGEMHASTAYTYNNLGNVYYYLGDFEKTINYYTQSLNIRLEVFDKRHHYVADSYNNLGAIYFVTTQYEKAISNYTEALDIRRKVFGERHTRVADSYSNLAGVYGDILNFEKAIDFYNKALEIRIDVLHEDHPSVSDAYNGLGAVYEDLGDYEKAIFLYQKALNIDLKTTSKNHPRLAFSYIGLGEMHAHNFDYEKATTFLNMALELRQKAFGEKHHRVADVYNSLGNIYLGFSEYGNAKKCYTKSLEIRLGISDEEVLQLANVYSNLGLVYSRTHEYGKAISFYYKALSIRQKLLAQEHPDITYTYNKLAVSYEGIGNYKTADSLWYLTITRNVKNLNDTYLFLPNNQRLKYAKKINAVYDDFFSFTAKHGSEDTKILAANLLLNTKSLALDYSLSAQELINNLEDEELKRLFDKLNAVKKERSQAEHMTLEERNEQQVDLAALHDQQEQLTREMLKNEILRKKLYKTPVAWKEAQNKLNATEVILDFVRFYEESDTMWMYYALLTHKDKSAPQFIRITDQKAISELLQTNGTAGYPNYIGNYEGLKRLYEKVWQPLTPYLKNIETIHLSPSGLMHRISFEALQDENEKYLAEDYEFHYYSTIRDFIVRKKTISPPSAFNSSPYESAVLFGDITYNLPPGCKQEDKMSTAVRDLITPLPATKDEINKVSEIIINNEGKCTQFVGSNATEQAIQNNTGSKSPDICHFATHAKYLSPIDKQDQQVALKHRLHTSGNPLQRSMLMLSGADNTWTSKEYISRSDNDGILTAYEVSHLDLSNTKLVVLSACNTGLGDIHDSEGVLGLQSAFKLAGANHVVASLWKVNDTATRDLMIAFYNNLLSKNQNAPTALRNAKFELLRLGAMPVNWAGFVLL